MLRFADGTADPWSTEFQAPQFKHVPSRCWVRSPQLVHSRSSRRMDPQSASAHARSPCSSRTVSKCSIARALSRLSFLSSIGGGSPPTLTCASFGP